MHLQNKGGQQRTSLEERREEGGMGAQQASMTFIHIQN